MRTFNRIKVLILPLTIMTGLLFLLHEFIYLVNSRSLSIDVSQNFFYFLMMAMFLMPMGMVITMTPWHDRLRAVTIAGYLWMGTFPILLLFSTLEMALSFFVAHSYSYWSFLVSIMVGLWALYNGLRPPALVRHELKGPPLMKGLRLVQISDIHVGMPAVNAKWLQKIVHRINELQADFVAITGDLADGAFEHVAPQLNPLQEMKAKMAKFYITGNHEYIREGDWEAKLKELDFTVLHNTHQLFERPSGKLMIAGVPDRMVQRFQYHLQSDPDRALASSEDIKYKILLAHEPASVKDLKMQTCDLILSGHTHGGQIFPFGALVRIVQPVVKGFKTINGVLVFAHQGTGFWGPPMRWGTRAEIVVFEWN